MTAEKKKTDGHFGNLPMGLMIGGSLRAAWKAQETLAEATAGVSGGGDRRAKAADFPFVKQVVGEDGTMKAEKTVLQVPVLAIVPVPAFSREDMNFAFDGEVKSSVRNGMGKRPEPAKQVLKAGSSPGEGTDFAVSSDEKISGSDGSMAELLMRSRLVIPYRKAAPGRCPCTGLGRTWGNEGKKILKTARNLSGGT